MTHVTVYPETPGLKRVAAGIIKSLDRQDRQPKPTNWARGGESDPIRYRIRRCDGNRDCWMLVRLDTYGNEQLNHLSFTTSTSLDLLLKHADTLAPNAGEHVDFIA